MKPASPSPTANPITERPAVQFEHASLDDLDGILAVEQSWPEEGRADASRFQSRLARFPQGFFVGRLHEQTRIVATVTSMPIYYDAQQVGAFKNWDAVTNGGMLFDTDMRTCNALYVVSGVIDTAYRGLNIFGPGILAQVKQAQQMGLRYVLAGAVMPGYRNYCERHGETNAFVYCRTRRGKHLVDPLLAMYEAIGFSVPNEHHVLADYFPDYASMDYAALVVRDLQTIPLQD